MNTSVLAPLRPQVEAFLSSALPLWFGEGLDEGQGMFVEALSFDGQSLRGLPRRARVQARQLYVLGLAYERGEFVGSAQQHAELMERVMESVTRSYGALGGGFHTLVGAEGQVLDSARVLYDQAFYLMALAWLYRVTGKVSYREEAEELWGFIETLRDPRNGGFQLSDAPESLPRQQNPHMHLFEACLLCAELLGKVPWLARADELYTLFQTRFLDTTTGPQPFLREFFTADWQPDPATGDHLDPGHHYEWTWLLGRYRTLGGAAAPELPLLYNTACAWGTDRDGLAYDEMLTGGRELRPTKRLWVQCEVLKGHLAYAHWSGDAQALERARHVLGNILSQYLTPQGTWADQLSRDHRNISENSPSSTLYHLYVALNEALPALAATP
ncbi:AGE family epimerase/isomerase [Deinococcus marmoris]|uniref:Mannose-6-phosphate isomerase n=1 Tax=Deinococcus marmoris TaxID=249408 RepID=A0A1U7NU34_9DEIO|nr:AGE family epimerase/isomerase [Deinococcus marmoris]OLV16426.1 Mannose-6-phosphate isomerase [Deinococcus marmoris]